MKLITFVSTAAVLMATAATAQAADLSATEAQKLESSLGAQGAGVYVDGGEPVVNVTSEAAAEQVEAAGATAKLVEHSDAELARVNETIRVAGNVPGMSWGIDPVTNQVVVTLDPTVDATEQAHVEAALASAGDAARIEHTDEAFTPLVAGGEAIYTGSSRCSLGFNVRNAANQNFFLTAGHCTNIGVQLGRAQPGPDRLDVRLELPRQRLRHRPLRWRARPHRRAMCPCTTGKSRTSPTARNAVRRRAGQAQRLAPPGCAPARSPGLNQTVRYAQGAVFGLIRTNVCAEPGDSGGSLFAGTAALGLTSGGSGNCTTGGTTFFQPVTEALSVYGMRVW